MKISLEEIKKVLPQRANVNFIKYRGKSPAIEIKVAWPSLSEEEHQEVIRKHRQIIGEENIYEFYTEETGHHWYIFLDSTKLIEIEI